VQKLAAGVGLRADRLELPLGALSGGERRRAELVRILFGGSDLLLLDEPTNHLDADARSWLLKFLRGYRGGLVVVSHDLDLLDDAITRVVHIDRDAEDATGELVEYRGSYSQYLEARARDEERNAAIAVRQTKEIARLSARADAMRGQSAKRARVARNFDVRVARIEAQRVHAPARRRTSWLRFPTPPAAGERLLVMGLNGAGKTTLLKILAGRLAADLGDVEVGLNVSAGYYAQEHENIVAGRSLLEHMRSASDAGDRELRNLLGMFGLAGDKAFQDAGTLSGGEKTKLALAQLVAGRHNVLLLDEPTNNLDPASRVATGEALAAWPGTMIVVSHDAEFVRSLAPDRALVMPEATLDHFGDEMLPLVELA